MTGDQSDFFLHETSLHCNPSLELEYPYLKLSLNEDLISWQLPLECTLHSKLSRRALKASFSDISSFKNQSYTHVHVFGPTCYQCL